MAAIKTNHTGDSGSIGSWRRKLYKARLTVHFAFADLFYGSSAREALYCPDEATAKETIPK